MTHKLALILGASLVLLGACASEPSAAPPTTGPQPAPRPAPAPVADQCGAAQAQRLVGRHRSEIPVPVNPGLQRVACTTCPVTMDFHPRRLNFFYDADTGLIKEVRCG
ncbi:peptidase inhibitor I78 [Phenylobacterium sp.]|uniref:peptidase inhibitor I78 n=1 Tax=Phenylobacterium sp. TaxID=1871053 RepID=UPI00272F8C6F|nr:peptidase inhibitor I78 [Phenylobacterium sp.]MDP1874627.1 peptidase inhibitor I78 [Phenylobacterium sp.]MDP3491376.1 peptidase inhibitor I78 [Phenylobacterium sp.]